MSNIEISTSDINILRNMSRDYVNSVGGTKTFGKVHRNIGRGGTVVDAYDGPFKVSPTITKNDTDINLKFVIAGGYAVGGNNTISFVTDVFDKTITEYNAVEVDKTTLDDVTLTVDDTIYRLNVISEIWWAVDGVGINGSASTITPTEITQNRAATGGTEAGDNIPDNDENGAYYARYQLATYMYKKTVKDGATTYTNYSFVQDQRGSILIASRYV